MAVEIYNVVDYFKYHQSKTGRRYMPRRIMMKLDNQRKVKIMKRLHTDLYIKLKTQGKWLM